MLYVPKFIPKCVKPGLRAVKPMQENWTPGQPNHGIWLPVRITYVCPNGCIAHCLATDRGRRCQGGLSATMLGHHVEWQGAAAAAEIEEEDAAQLERALFRYDFDTSTQFTQAIALERYLRLIKSGEILKYVEREETDF